MSSTARSPASTSTPDPRYDARFDAVMKPASSTGFHRTRTEVRGGAPRRHRPEVFFEHELAAGRVVRHGLRVVAVEAREAEPLVRQVECRQDAPDGEVAQGVGPDELADLGLAVGGRDELG